MSQLPFDGHRHDVNEAGCRQLLEMHTVRQRMERDAFADRFVRRAAMATVNCIGPFQQHVSTGVVDEI